MKQVLVHEFGGPEVLRCTDSVPIPEPKDGEVLIKNAFSGINYVDTNQRKGVVPGSLPSQIGQETSGSVVKVEGSNQYGFRSGDRVVAWVDQGGYAEYSVARAEMIVKIPGGVTERDAAGAFLMGMTALTLVKEAYPVAKGESVLVHAAAGGMGQLLCQILNDLGAFIIGTAGSAEKCAVAKERGAHHCIDYNADPEWPQRVLELTEGKGVTAVYDSVGASTWEGSFKAVKRQGKIVFFGSSSGPVPPFSIIKLAEKNTSIARPSLKQSITTRDELLYYSDMLFRLMLDEKLNVRYHNQEFALEEAEQAHRALEERKSTGKLLLKL